MAFVTNAILFNELETLRNCGYLAAVDQHPDYIEPVIVIKLAQPHSNAYILQRSEIGYHIGPENDADVKETVSDLDGVVGYPRRELPGAATHG